MVFGCELCDEAFVLLGLWVVCCYHCIFPSTPIGFMVCIGSLEFSAHIVSPTLMLFGSCSIAVFFMYSAPPTLRLDGRVVMVWLKLSSRSFCTLRLFGSGIVVFLLTGILVAHRSPFQCPLKPTWNMAP